MQAIACLGALCKFCVGTGSPRGLIDICCPVLIAVPVYVAKLCQAIGRSTMITRAVLLFSTVRQFLPRQIKTRAPLVTAVLHAVPVKTLAFLNGAGVVSVIFASVQKVQLDTFGAACGALALLLLPRHPLTPETDAAPWALPADSGGRHSPSRRNRPAGSGLAAAVTAGGLLSSQRL